MENASGFLTQSKFYSPAFNAAIFDGPVRIYFAQHQENSALSLYFYIQDKMKELGEEVKSKFVESGKNIFVMMYPTTESFYMSFDKSHSSGSSDEELIVEESLGEDMVVGIRGPFEDKSCDSVYKSIESIFSRSMPDFLVATL